MNYASGILGRFVCALAGAITPFATAISGAVLPPDFGANSVIQSFDSLGLPLSVDAPVVIDGDIFTTDTGQLQYSSFSSSCVSGSCIATWSDNGFIEVAFQTPVQKAGAFINGHSHLVGWPIVGEFFDTSYSLIDAVTVVGLTPPPIFNPPPVFEFVGYEASGNVIKYARFNDAQNNGFGMTLDNLMVESASVPEPSIFWLAMTGICLLGLTSRAFSFAKHGKAPIQRGKGSGLTFCPRS